MSAFGNRCDVFKQVGITGTSGIPSLCRSFNVLSPDGKLSLGHMLQSHITPVACSQSTAKATTSQPYIRPLVLLPHMGVTFTPALVLLSQQCPPAILPRMEMNLSCIQLAAVGGRNLCKGRKVFFLLAFSCEQKKATGSALVSSI